VANVNGQGILVTGYTSATGNVTGGNLIGNILSPAQVVINAGGQSEGGQLVLAYTNISGLTAQGNSSWSIDVDSGNTFRVFYQNAAGASNVLINANSTSNVVTFPSGGGISVAGNISGNTAGFTIGYLNIPQVSFAANATLALTDAGKHYYSTTAGNLALTIANNASVSWPIGATITVIERAAGNIIITPGTGVSLYYAGNATAGSRVLSAYGMATLINVEANVWMVNGSGLT